MIATILVVFGYVILSLSVACWVIGIIQGRRNINRFIKEVDEELNDADIQVKDILTTYSKWEFEHLVSTKVNVRSDKTLNARN